MYSKLYGSLALAATTPLKDFPQFDEQQLTFSGNHTQHRFRGAFSLLRYNAAEESIALPQRGKYMNVTVVSGTHVSANYALTTLVPRLAGLDSRFEGARHLNKLHRVMQEVEVAAHPTKVPYVAVINNINNHPYFALLSHGIPLHIFGVYDTVNRSIRLVWTTVEDFVSEVRAADPMRYVFYRFPVMKDRPLFINTAVVCSNWHQKWAQSFTDVDGVLKSFNALEAFLYKDPTLDVLPVNKSKR